MYHHQVQALQDPCQDSFRAEKELHQKWSFLREIEEMFFRQKSRITWLREGDLNTAYFLRICQTRASYNAIRAFLTATDTWITDPLLMSSHAVDHFQSVFAPVIYQPPSTYSSSAWFLELTDFTFPMEHLQQMISIPSPDEIRSCMFKLNPSKAPEPDGLTSRFFKASWEVVGGEVITAIQNFFASKFLPATTNSVSTLIFTKGLHSLIVLDFKSSINLRVSKEAKTFDRGKVTN
ncbi:uncharacterized protein LOC130496139 [Raphanus sativus]|uniref:Uncharacterized protein LOC130496139 n=1 Tax=Raphanus sativus TaxID=3726 RepID=A0A9W3BXG3_RAPSA|nr:uncharacterized protein LOC130496139 [Raphanus sativus]